MNGTPKPLSLSTLQAKIKEVLEQALPESCWVMAEINELKYHQAGHCYLELIEKEEASNVIRAKASATIWSYSLRMLKPYFETSTGRALSSGIQVLIKANVQYHPIFGLSLNITDIDPAYTVGEMVLQRQKTVTQLKAEGVFNMNKELDIPILPQRIAVISSEQAAGYRDFMNHLHHNECGYAFHTELFPALMQGASASQSIMDALELVNGHIEAFDILAIIRGGGAVTDLACFDDYSLASHVAQFPLPVLTGIGHDKDESITDMVANTALKTPTAVADFLVNCLDEQQAMLNEWSYSLDGMVRKEIQAHTQHIWQLTTTLCSVVKTVFKESEHQLQLTETTLQLRNPETILSRGYAVAIHDGKTLTDAKQVNVGDEITIVLHKGKLKSKVSSQ